MHLRESAARLHVEERCRSPHLPRAALQASAADCCWCFSSTSMSCSPALPWQSCRSQSGTQ